jgi:hypothetical protein
LLDLIEEPFDEVSMQFSAALNDFAAVRTPSSSVILVTRDATIEPR